MKKYFTPHFTSVFVKEVTLETAEDDPSVVLETHQKGTGLSFPIGPNEASAIILQIEGVHPLRPLTHDLLAQAFRIGGLKPLALEIYQKKDGRYFSKILYKKNWKIHQMETRPSDAIALALRLDFPILVRNDLLLSLQTAAETHHQPAAFSRLHYQAPPAPTHS